MALDINQPAHSSQVPPRCYFNSWDPPAGCSLAYPLTPSHESTFETIKRSPPLLSSPPRPNGGPCCFGITITPCMLHPANEARLLLSTLACPAAASLFFHPGFESKFSHHHPPLSSPARFDSKTPRSHSSNSDIGCVDIFFRPSALELACYATYSSLLVYRQV